MVGMIIMENKYICELCRREGVPKITEHHFIPKEEGDRDGDVA